jgi:hypothetical protein
MKPSNVETLPVTREERGLQIQSWKDLTDRAEFLAKSSLIPQGLRGKPADVAIILQMGLELGISPMQSLNAINVIQGKPSLSPEGMIGLIYSKIPDAFIKIDADQEKQVVTVTMARGRDRKDEAFTTKWDIPRATKLGYMGKDNYKTQPMVMLKWRAVGEAARTVFPDVLKGLKGDEEMADFGNEGGNGETPKDAKVAALDAILDGEPTKQENQAKEVIAEVVQPEPVEPPEALEVSFTAPVVVMDPLAEYVPKHLDFKGKPLKEFQKSYLKEYAARVKNHFKANLTGDWLELVTRIEQYTHEATFANFEPGASE